MAGRFGITATRSLCRHIMACRGRFPPWRATASSRWGRKCQVACWDAGTGKARWLIDLVLDYGATVPPWYAGQCPLIDTKTDRLIVAPGGKALVMAIDYRTGKVVWQSPNPHGWTMTHVSIMPMEFAGRRMYVYCGKGGVAGVAPPTAASSGTRPNGRSAWPLAPRRWSSATAAFSFAAATTPAPDAAIRRSGGRIVPPARSFAWRPGSSVRNSRRRSSGTAVFTACGRRTRSWSASICKARNSGTAERDKFGSGPYMIADGLIYVLDDDGLLTMAEAAPAATSRWTGPR